MDKRISVTKRMPNGQRALDSVESLVGTDSPDDFEYEGQFEANASNPLTQTASAVASGHATMARNAATNNAVTNKPTTNGALQNDKSAYVTVDNPDDFE